MASCVITLAAFGNFGLLLHLTYSESPMKTLTWIKKF